MKVFELNKDYSVVCQHVKTRTAFKHTAAVMKQGILTYKTKICYQNRTWESYDFQSVLHKAIDAYFTKDEAKELKKKADAEEKQRISGAFNAVAMAAVFGDILCNTKEEKNNWKMRMLKAGIRGIDPPADWDTLPEDEKERRLNGAIEALR